MKVLSWNIQGIKKPQALQELSFLKQNHKSDILFILETLVTYTHLLRILPKLGFDYCKFASPVNHAGGIAVLRNSDNIHASILSKSNRTIHLLVHDTSTSISSIISGIYAPTQQREKDSFWNLLSKSHMIFDLPWCIIGDFNELANPSEKGGGICHPNTKYQRLNNFLTQNNAISVPVNLFSHGKNVYICI